MAQGKPGVFQPIEQACQSSVTFVKCSMALIYLIIN